jgi:hypothetical protein
MNDMEKNELRKSKLIDDIIFRRAKTITAIEMISKDDFDTKYVAAGVLRGMLFEAFETGMEFDEDIRSQYEPYHEHNS